MKKHIERRITDAKITVRANDDGTVGVRGYAAVFDSPSNGEVIKRSAFNRTIAQKDNVRFLVNHEGVPFGSTRAGTMTIGVDAVGLWFDLPSLDIENNPKVQEFCSAVGRGDMYQCSFAGYFRDTPTVDGLREVREVELVDCSGVTYPWYEETSMSLTGDRSLDNQLVSARSLQDRPELSAEQRAHAFRALRTAPAGKTSINDFGYELWDALDLMVGGWCLLCDWGTDSTIGDGRATNGWAVYRVFNMMTYELDDDYMQVAWKQATDATFTFGAPFEVQLVYEPMTPAEIVADDAGEPGEANSYTIAEARALLGLTSAA